MHAYVHAYIYARACLCTCVYVYTCMCMCACVYVYMDCPRASDGKESASNTGDQGSFPGWDNPLEKKMASHCSILAWSISWTEEPGGLQSTGLQRDMTQRLQYHFQTYICMCIYACLCAYSCMYIHLLMCIHI